MSGSDWAKELSCDPQLGLAEKWRRFQVEKSRRGVKAPYYLNKWVPWYFFSILTGAYAWYALVAVPAHHSRHTGWFFFNELFGLYVEIQLIVNWFLVSKSDSSYKADDNNYEAHLQNNCISVTVNDNDSAHYRGGMSTNNGLSDGGDISPDKLSGEWESSEHPRASAVEQNPSLEVDPNPDTDFSCSIRRVRTGLTYKMMVATAINPDGTVQRQAYPYWSWTPCLWCRRLRPPRCHHCNLCGHCVLKRDHHCYFTRACIGINNERHLLKFLFWSIVMTTLATCEVGPYTVLRVFSRRTYWNAIFPVNVLNVFLGGLSVAELHLIFMLWSLIFLLFISLGMFCFHLLNALRGLTKFEYDNSISVRDTRPIFTRLRAVMGRNWGLAVLWPGYNNGPPLDDGIRWQYVKP